MNRSAVSGGKHWLKNLNFLISRNFKKERKTKKASYGEKTQQLIDGQKEGTVNEEEILRSIEENNKKNPSSNKGLIRW